MYKYDEIDNIIKTYLESNGQVRSKSILEDHKSRLILSNQLDLARMWISWLKYLAINTDYSNWYNKRYPVVWDEKMLTDIVHNIIYIAGNDVVDRPRILSLFFVCDFDLISRICTSLSESETGNKTVRKQP